MQGVRPLAPPAGVFCCFVMVLQEIIKIGLPEPDRLPRAAPLLVRTPSCLHAMLMP